MAPRHQQGAKVNLFQELDSDWRRVVADGSGRRACLQWSGDPVLAHVRCPQQLVDEIRTANDPARSDELLSAIVRLAPNDETAARLVLQALIPGLRCIARRFSFLADQDEVEATVVASAWTRIRTYPHERRPRRVAANVVLDTRKEALRALRAAAPLARPQTTSDTEAGRIEVEADLVALVNAAHHCGLISEHEAQLIISTRLEGQSLTAVADTIGSTSGALGKRRAAR